MSENDSTRYDLGSLGFQWVTPTGLLHRTGGPAFFFSAGGEVIEQWWLEGKLHRLDGPAAITSDQDSNPIYEFWYKHGEYHRSCGPARLWGNGSEEWWFEGTRLHFEIEKHLHGIRFDSEKEFMDTIDYIKELQMSGRL